MDAPVAAAAGPAPAAGTVTATRAARAGEAIIPDAFAPGPAAMPETVPAPAAKRRWPVVAGAVLGLALVGGVAVRFATHAGDGAQPAASMAADTGAAPAPAASTTIATTAGTEAATPASALQQTTAPTVTSTLASTPAADMAPAPVAPPGTAFDLRRAFDDVVAGADPAFGVQASALKSKVVIGHDRFGFTISARQAGYFYLQMLSNDGSAPTMIFPNADEPGNRIEAGQTVRLPRSKLRLDVNGPAGIDRFVAIVSARPRDFKAVSEAPTAENQLFSTFSIARLRTAALPAGVTSPLAGVAVCEHARPCSQRYGAAAFKVEEAKR